MALEACKECGKKISSFATSCPHCGFSKSSIYVDGETIKELSGLNAQISNVQTKERESHENHFHLGAEIYRIIFIFGGAFILFAFGFSGLKSFLLWLAVPLIIAIIVYSVYLNKLKKRRENAEKKRDDILSRLKNR